MIIEVNEAIVPILVPTIFTYAEIVLAAPVLFAII